MFRLIDNLRSKEKWAQTANLTKAIDYVFRLSEKFFLQPRGKIFSQNILNIGLLFHFLSFSRKPYPQSFLVLQETTLVILHTDEHIVQWCSQYCHNESQLSSVRDTINFVQQSGYVISFTVLFGSSQGITFFAVDSTVKDSDFECEFSSPSNMAV